MERQAQSEILTEVVNLLAKSRALMRKGEYVAAEIQLMCAVARGRAY
jgi:hypothetical protein